LTPGGTELAPLSVREEKAIKLLESRSRALQGAKALVEDCGPCQDRIEAALDEAAAILSDAATVCRSGEPEV
jgi:bacterioferritin-associated ferredoxin